MAVIDSQLPRVNAEEGFGDGVAQTLCPCQSLLQNRSTCRQECPFDFFAYAQSLRAGSVPHERL